MRRIVFVWVLLCLCLMASAQETYLFAQKDTSTLYLDIYRPAAGAATQIDGVDKPTVLFVFGGGFLSGARNDAYLLPFFRTLTDNGYSVVAVDYRLGMKGYKMGKGLSGLAKSVKPFCAAQQMGVEDVFSAIAYLAEHPELGIDPMNIVVSGNSAGAIISLACARDVANGAAQGLPDGFRFRGVLSFSGAIISAHGAPKFDQLPCPILFFHGLNDNAVAYHYVGAFGMGMWGSSYWAEQLAKRGGNYSIYRFKNRAHDVAAYMNLLWPEVQAFLETNVMQGVMRIVDATIDNPSLPIWQEWGSMTPQQMYSGK